MDLSVIIPAYNEATGIRAVLADIQSVVPDAEILVVDDCSTDGTGDTAAAASARVIRHRANRGYGGALKRGIRAAHHDFFEPLSKHATSKLPWAVAKALSICAHRSGNSWRAQERCSNGSN